MLTMYAHNIDSAEGSAHEPLESQEHRQNFAKETIAVQSPETKKEPFQETMSKLKHHLEWLNFVVMTHSRSTVNDLLEDLSESTVDCVQATQVGLRKAFKEDNKLFRYFFREQSPQMKTTLCFMLSLTEEDNVQRSCLHDIGVETRSMLQQYTFVSKSKVLRT